MLVRIISLIECLLPCHLSLSVYVRPVGLHVRINAIVEELVAIVESLLFFFGALLEKDFAQHVFLLFVRIVVLHVVVVGLIEYAIGVMVAIWVLISDSTSLA